MAGSHNLKLDFITLDVFTETRFKGNPLAVVFIPAALKDRLTQETKQRVAREFNLSETVFLYTLDDEPNKSVTTRQIDIFTPEEELPFAGHPTIGSAYLVLHHLGWTHVDTLLTKAGPIRIESLQQETGSNQTARRVRAAIPHAVHIHQQTLGTLLASASENDDAATARVINSGLSTDPEVQTAELAAPVVSIVRGITFVLVQLPSLAHLARAAPGVSRLDFGQIGGALLDQGEWHESFVSRYYYVPMEDGTSKGKLALRTRMVELAYEDPATGSAACTLASYLAMKEQEDREMHFDITQGVEMGRTSEIAVDAVSKVGESGEVELKELYLGGTAAVVMSGSISV